jgi:hypothetical protein
MKEGVTEATPSIDLSQRHQPWKAGVAQPPIARYAMNDVSPISLPDEQTAALQDAVPQQYDTSAAVPQGSALIDRWQLHEQLFMCGAVNPDHPYILCLFPGKEHLNDGRGTWRYVCQGHGIPYDRIASDLRKRRGAALGFYVNPPLPQPATWGTDPSHFGGGRFTGDAAAAEKVRRRDAWLAGLPGVIPPATWGTRNEHISHARFVWFEGDSGNPIEEQFALAERCLGAPTYTVHTGSKSLHCYYRLTASIQPDEWKAMQGWIIRALSGVAPDAGIDKSIINEARLMRLAGGLHPATGNRCKVHSYSGITYDPLQLIDRLKHIMPAPAPVQRQPKRFTRPLRATSRFSRVTTLDDIRQHLSQYPPRIKAGQGTYDSDRDVLWGLICACQGAGFTIDDAIDLMADHSPGWGRGAIEQVAGYSFNQVTAGSFWSLAGAIRRAA